MHNSNCFHIEDSFDIFLFLNAPDTLITVGCGVCTCVQPVFGTSHPANNTRAEVAFMELRCGPMVCVCVWGVGGVGVLLTHRKIDSKVNRHFKGGETTGEIKSCASAEVSQRGSSWQRCQALGPPGPHLCLRPHPMARG